MRRNTMMKVNLTSGNTLDAHEVKCNGYTFDLLDRNGDKLNTVGSPLVETIEPFDR